jgi:NCS2 family nucleobase:cation symporter-2
MDNRRTFVIGVAIIFGLSRDLLPGLYVGIPHDIRPFFESSLTLTTVLAVVLNQVLRLGKR